MDKFMIKLQSIKLIEAGRKFQTELKEKVIDKILSGGKVSEKWDGLYPNDFSDYFKLIKIIESGNETKVLKFVRDMDTDPRDKIPQYLWKEIEKL